MATIAGLRAFLAAVVVAVVAPAAVPAGAQAPGDSRPYREEELTIVNGAVSLAGTLSIPAGKGPFPAAVLITGSGPQNRDEELFGFKVFGAIADHFARRGIAVYRYDDRGVGKSSGSVFRSTTDDFASDAVAIVTRLKERPEIDARRIGLLGHSEGGPVAAIAASRSSDVAFVVMLAGSSVRGDRVVRQQMIDLMKSQGVSDAALARIVDAHSTLLDAVMRDAPRADVDAAARRLAEAQYDGMPPARREAVGAREPYVEKAAKGAVPLLMVPWTKFILGFDPAPVLRQVKVPVFAAFGALDVQVPTSLNEAPMREALSGNAAVTIKTYPHANHLFQSARTGMPDEYPKLEKAFVPGLLDDLTTWITSLAERK
jgi:pimeloyl-ACP methyl ester carboxylesterase